uniref:RRM domain-containing protein n=1 Tax=Compsopogon caeruleus TaxID=31354 RepID=A0A7S1TD30_9RHOD
MEGAEGLQGTGGDDAAKVPELMAKPTLMPKPVFGAPVKNTDDQVGHAEGDERREQDGEDGANDQEDGANDQEPKEPVGEATDEEGDADQGKTQEEVLMTTYTECVRCGSKFAVSDRELGDKGRKVQCGVCKHVWFQHTNRLSELAEGESLRDMTPAEQDIAIERTKTRSRRATSDAGASEGGSQFTLFVGNLPFSVSEDDLRVIFSQHCKVQRVHIATTEGRSRGFAFVDVASEEDMKLAIEKVSGMDVGGREVSVRQGNSSRK